jgi:hypothetical protein
LIEGADIPFVNEPKRRIEMTSIIKKAIPLAASLLLLAGSPAFAGTYHLTRSHGLTATAYTFDLPPSSIRNDNPGHYCLTSDSQNDCGFTSLAQCEATASGGLGECNAR